MIWHKSMLLVLALALAAAGCAPTPLPVARPPREAPPPPTAPQAAPTPASGFVPAEPGVTLYYAENGQVELIDPAGTRVLFDVYDPARLSSPATGQDVLLITQNLPDHVDAAFLASFPGPKIAYYPGELEFGGIAVRGIASARRSTESIDPQAPTNTIFVVDMAGLRIAHFGDLGQDALTAEQLTALGAVDVAIAQLSNAESDMDYANRKGFTLLQQVEPRLIIPTHNSMMAARHANDLWHCVYSPRMPVVITRAKLERDVRCVLLGSAGATFQQMLKLQVVEW